MRRQPLTQQQREAVINQVSKLSEGYMKIRGTTEVLDLGTMYERHEETYNKVQTEKRSIVSHLQDFINKNMPALIDGTADLKSLYDEALKSDSRNVRTGFLRLGKVHHVEPNGRVGQMVMMLCEACDPNSQNYCRAPLASQTPYVAPTKAQVEARASQLSGAPNPKAGQNSTIPTEEEGRSNGPGR